MKIALLILLAGVIHTQGAFVEGPKRDSILVGDHIRYGVTIKDVKEGTPLALPEIKPEDREIIDIIGSWQLDSVRVSAKKETPARYDIRASITLTPYWGGKIDLPEIPVLLGADTLVFNPLSIDVTEPTIDMDAFTPADIKPQAKIPYTFAEVAPWAAGIIVFALALFLFIRWFVNRRSEEAAKIAAEPAHIRALRLLDKYRGDKYWKKEQQKAFYSGVTDTIREYMASRWGIGAMEMTTAEIFPQLKGLEDIPGEQLDAMQTLFERADFVKFAKYTASDEENAEVLPAAVRFVMETTPVTSAEKDEEE